MDYQSREIECPDGRSLDVATIGEPSGDTVFFHHGTPGSSPMVASLGALAERGLFVVTFSRPGYGSSTRREGRRVASVADDVRVALDALGRHEYASVGWSGGGPHALACAALDERCVAAWSIAGVAPIGVDFDWTAGMGPENLEEFALAIEGGEAYERYMAEAGAQFADATSDNVVELFGGLLSAVDRDVLADLNVREVMAESMRHAFASGWRGFYDDDRTFFSPWGFNPATITVPVSIWYGDEDLMVPPTHGAWLASHVGTATVHHFADDGHLSLLTRHSDQLIDDVARAFD